MQTSNVFHVSRFVAYLKKNIIDNYRLYLASLILLTVTVFTVILFNFSFNKNGFDKGDSEATYLLGMFVAGLIFTGFSFSRLADKSKGMDFLLLPASHFEKFLTPLLMTTVGFMLVYHLSCFLAVVVGFGILKMQHVTDVSFAFSDVYNPEYSLTAMNAWFLVHSVILLGSTYFHRYTIIKTALYLFLFVVGIGFLNAFIVSIVFGGHVKNWGAVPFFGVNVVEHADDISGHTEFLRVPDSMLHVYDIVWRFVLPPVFWVLAYYRLKDKEI